MKQQKIQRTPQASAQPSVINTSTRPTNRPVRTVIFIEAGGMDQAQFAALAGHFAAEYEGRALGEHYFVPVRDGKLTSDPLFEQEFLEIIKQICEVKDGEIALREGARDVKVIREFVGG